MSFQELCKQLEQKIKDAYENGVTMSDAEKLAGEFLEAQIKVSNELKTASLDARMRKSGVKAIRSAIYMKEATKESKKPSDVLLDALVNTNDVVQSEQDELDKAEVLKEDLERYYSIFQNAHIFYRAVAKGVFGG